jgi:hypothetical protein
MAMSGQPGPGVWSAPPLRDLFCRWAQRRGLVPSETGYVARTRERRPLRFSVSEATEIECAYRAHWVSPELSAARR